MSVAIPFESGLVRFLPPLRRVPRGPVAIPFESGLVRFSDRAPLDDANVVAIPFESGLVRFTIFGALMSAKVLLQSLLNQGWFGLAESKKAFVIKGLASGLRLDGVTGRLVCHPAPRS